MIFGLKLRNIFFIFIGAAIMAFGIVHFNMQNNLAEGGFTGITLLLYFLFHFDPSYTNLILNVPIFFIGWKILGRKTFLYSIIGTLSESFFLWVFQRDQMEVILNDDLLLAALFAGVFIGIGLGIIFRFGGTTGGVDIIARLVNKYLGWSMGKTMFLFDVVVISLSFVCYLSYKEAMYTLVAVFVGSRTIDFLQEGAYKARGVTIISDKNEEIARRIAKEMDRGVTVFKAKGYFTQKERDALYCVVGKNEIVKLKNLIISVDPHSFVTVSEVYEVLGEGFTLDSNKKPIE